MVKIKLRLGGKWVTIGGSGGGGGGDYDDIIDLIDGMKVELEKNIDKLRTELENTDEYINNAFKDGIITEVEAKKIQSYLNNLLISKELMDKRFEEIFKNKYLPVVNKEGLVSANNVYQQKFTNLNKVINDAIADGKATKEESAMVDVAFTEYRQALSLLASALEIAIDAINEARNKKTLDDAKDYTDDTFVPLEERVVTAESAIETNSREIKLRVTEEQLKAGVDDALDNAKKYSDEQRKALDESLEVIRADIQETEDYVNGAFKDGIVYDAEKRKIEGYLNTLNTSKEMFDKRYETVQSNSYLETVPKQNLENAKGIYDGKYKALVDLINEVIEDQKATPEEASEVNMAFGEYNEAVSLLTVSLEVAIDSISKSKAEEAKELAEGYAKELSEGLDEKIKQVQKNLTETSEYIDNAFKDGIVSTTEVKRIEGFLVDVEKDFASLIERYSSIYSNDMLGGTAKTALFQSKVDYEKAYNDLKSKIEEVIQDGLITDTESQEVTLALLTYRDRFKDFTKALEVAIDYISSAKAADAKQHADDIVKPVEARLTKAESDITQNADQIRLRVKEETYNQGMELVDGIDTRLKSAESTILVQGDAITSKVGVEAVGAIEAGAPNLLENTSFSLGLWPFQAGRGGYKVNMGVTHMGRSSVEYVYPGTDNTYPLLGSQFIDLRETNWIGKKLTMSFYLFVPEDAKFDDIVYVEACGYENTDQSVNASIGRRSVTVAELADNVGVWKKYQFSFTVPSSTSNGVNNFLRVLLRLALTRPTGKEHVFWALPKLEVGETDTIWMPSVQDHFSEFKGFVRRKKPLSTRYVRVTATGPNTVNSAYHPVSLAVISKGVDLARGKMPTAGGGPAATNLERITNGNTDTANYATLSAPSTYGQWFKLDLGEVRRDVEYINLINYYSGERSYRFKIEVSPDDVNWIELYSTQNQGMYTSTFQGGAFFVNGVDSINSLQSTVVQQAGLISQKVSQDGVISAINQSPETIQLQANKIALDGFVEAKHIKSLLGLNINNKFVVDNAGNVSFAGTLNGAGGTFSGKVSIKSGNNYINIEEGSITAFNDSNDYTGSRLRIIGGELRFESSAGTTYYGKIFQDRADSILTFINPTGFSFQSKFNGAYFDNLHTTGKLSCGNLFFNGYNTIRNDVAGIYLEGMDTVRLNNRTHNDATFSVGTDSDGARVYSMGIYNRTYSYAANMYVTNAGTVGRATSALKYKLVVEKVKDDLPERILDLDPKTWFDKRSAEMHADLETLEKGVNRDGTPISPEKSLKSKDLEDLQTLERVPGLIAEDLIEAGLEQYVIYGEADKDGKREPEGIMYDRVWTLLIPLVKEQREQLDLLQSKTDRQQTEIDELKAELLSMKKLLTKSL